MPKILPILTLPNAELRKKSLSVVKKRLADKDLAELCNDMSKTMLEKDGVGLAAPQIGKKIRLIVINTKNGPIIMANPKIIKKSWLKEWGEEGCLSVPGIFGEVKRHKKITCAFLDEKCQDKIVDAAGLLSRVIQHEVDHLDGVLFIDKAKNVKKNNV